jgi:ribonuclease P protein component
LPASRRLKLRREFDRVRIEGRTVRGGLLLLGLLQTGGEGAFRVGFVTSRRVGGAVVRNRVRRRLREIVRRHQPALASGLWLVVIARPAAARASSAALEEEWLRLVKRAEVMRPSSVLISRALVGGGWIRAGADRGREDEHLRLVQRTSILRP